MQISFLSGCHSVILMSPGEMWKEADAGTSKRPVKIEGLGP